MLNAKQRRKLLREQQQQQQKQEEGVCIEEQIEKETIETSSAIGKDEEKLNSKERRRLARQAKQKREVGTGEELTTGGSSAPVDDKQPLNAQQRRLLNRQDKRKHEGVESMKPVQKKRKKQTMEEDNDAYKSIHLTLFVGQLPFCATEEMIRKHFAKAGDIKIRMRTDKKTKKFKGTAFIEVKDSKALGAALSRHHTLLQGRRINVELTASGGGNKSENRRNKIDLLRKKQSNVQVEKTKALIQKHIDGPEYQLKQEDVDDRMIDFLSWFDYETAKNALDEYNRCVSDRVNNRKAFFMGILKRFRQTDGDE
ncbi:unnamed protein product [Peronospora belbahrii]|uniref:RRM domain-containing protein n=1 Tax=Peronospora belbahrii TaxID=622444 RepID=A0AAU9KQ92_9STRA|nr:unnamed protein product [Peronospora belbahrii]